MIEIPNGNPGSSQGLFASADRTRIAQLALGQPAEPEASPYIEAVVSLVWPYSNKDRLLSLLLAEPDVRLRSAKGQLKVTFHGAGARQVAKSQVGIGDIVLLRIDHAEWKDTGDAVLTPGRKVQWDLHFKNRVVLEVRRNGNPLTTIDYEGSDTPPPPVLEAAASQNARSQQIIGFHDNTSIVFSTPAHGRSKRISSGSFIDASLDPFADDDGFVLGKGRKKTKFGRTSGSWKLVGEGETSEHEEDPEATSEDAVVQIMEEYVLRSPAKASGPPDVIMLDDDSSPEASPIEASMPPPLAPFRRPPETASEAYPQTDRLTTPRLHPLASPGLPMVSPLVKIAGASAGYFDAHSSVSSELDAISVSSTSPQEEIIASAVGENLDDGLPEDYEQLLKEAERLPLKTMLDSTSQNVEPIPLASSTGTAEAQSAAFSNAAATSPFGFASSGFPGFASQSELAFPSTVIGTSTAQSPFGVPSTSFGSPAGFSSFGNSSGFGLSRGNGIGLGFGFATPATNTSARPLAGSQGELGSQYVLGNDLQKQTLQEREVAADEQRIKSPVVQIDLETFRRERELSEDDDDMYGSARPTRRSPSMASVTSRRSESIRRNGEELLDVTMSDLDTGKLPPVAFPFSQDWNNKTQTDRLRLRQSPFLDGASDELSEYESSEHGADAEVQPERVSTPMSSESLELVDSVEAAADLEVVDLVPSTNVEDAARFESVTRAQIAVGPILELQGRPIPQTQAEARAITQVGDDDDSLEELTAVELELKQPEVMHNTEQNLMDHPQTDEDVSKVDDDGAKARQEQLLTPVNTQQDFLAGHSFESLQQVPSLQMPPTPDNTQEPAYADILRLDGTNEARFIEQKEDGAGVTSPTPTQNQKDMPRPSRETLNVPAASSPYFTARSSSRLSPERQTKDVENVEPEEEVDKEKAMEQPVQDLLAREPDQTAALSPRHDKRLHNMLGMATPISYYTPLPNLDEHYNQHVDILAICTDDSGLPTRSKAGPKDYNVTLHLADSFLNGAATVTAQLFRPYKPALPLVHRGEVILLRSFKVQSQKRKMMLLSTNSSAWAVFSLSDVSAKDAEFWDVQIDVAGPPVEYGPEEYVYAKRLMEWWERDGSFVHKVMTPKTGDFPTRPRTRDGPDRADTTGDGSEHVTNGTKNGLVNAYNSQAIDPPRTTRSSKRINNQTDNMENHDQTKEKSLPLSPTFEPTSPTPARTTRSSRRAANRTDNTSNEDDPGTAADAIDPLPEIASPKTGRRTRRSTSIPWTPELSRSLRPQSTVHELRDGTKYVDGHVPTKKDGVHQLRDGTKYVDENISPVGKTPSVKEKSLVHELRDGTNYVDRSKSPEVRRSARNKRGGSVVHELRDGAKYTDG